MNNGVTTGGSVADGIVKSTVRAELPASTFARRPLRCLFVIPLTAIAIAVSTLLVVLDINWYIAALLSIVLGNVYGSMMFLAHEIGHGATVRSRGLQRLLMYPGCAIFLLSPHLWCVWHNQSHHAHTNVVDEDPDNFGTLAAFDAKSRWAAFLLKLAPGSRYLRSALYMFLFFTLQAQGVLWEKSRRMPGYASLNRTRAAIDSIIIAFFWIAVSLAVGLRDAIFVVVVPMLVANFVMLSYVVTNHMLRPLGGRSETLLTTMSVKTLWILDRIHFHFSHHVEHHLFPAMPSSMTPRVRSVLVRRFGDHYLAPSHPRALAAVLRTPRLYETPEVLVDPFRDRRSWIPEVEVELRNSAQRSQRMRHEVAG